MSICSASLVPFLAVNGLQVAGSSQGVIPANTIYARDDTTPLDTSKSYYVIDNVNRLVYLFLGIQNVDDFPAGASSAEVDLLYIRTTASIPASVLPPINANVIDSPSMLPVSTLSYRTDSTDNTFFGVFLNNISNNIEVGVGAQWGQSLTVEGGASGLTVVPIPIPASAQNIIGTIIYPF